MTQIKITVNAENPTEKDIINAVRRAFDKSGILFVEGTKGTVKDVTFAVRKSPVARPNVMHIREWAAANGFEVGKRGRLTPEVQAAFKAANKK